MCALCDQEDEITDYLLLACVYSREVWHRLLNSVRLQTWAPQPQDSLLEWWQLHRSQAPTGLRKCFDSMVMLTASAWSLWKERNRRVFDGALRLPHQLCQLCRLFSSLAQLISLVVAYWSRH